MIFYFSLQNFTTNFHNKSLYRVKNTFKIIYLMFFKIYLSVFYDMSKIHFFNQKNCSNIFFSLQKIKWHVLEIFKNISRHVKLIFVVKKSASKSRTIRLTSGWRIRNSFRIITCLGFYQSPCLKLKSDVKSKNTKYFFRNTLIYFPKQEVGFGSR